MQIDEIPQIKPKETVQNKSGNELPNLGKSDSILDPVGKLPIGGIKAENMQTPPKPTKIKKKIKFSKKLLIIPAVLALLLLAIVIPSISVYKNAKQLYSHAQSLKTYASQQDIEKVKSELDLTQSSLTKLRKSFGFIKWTRIIPFFGRYTKDADNALAAADLALSAGKEALATLEPYLSTLGFGNSSQDGDGAKTAQERIDFFVSAIPDLIPKMDNISKNVAEAQIHLGTIDSERYPISITGKKVREPLQKALEAADSGAEIVTQVKPILEASPYLLGLNEPRTYLVLFQNDKELRPTGGFMTAYSIMKVDKARFEPVSSSDIYNLDSKYKPTIKAPDPIVKYLKGPYTLSPNLLLRDMNWSPDFGQSMEQFMKEAEKAGMPDVDGVIAVDTQLLVNLLDVLGPIGVPGFGNYSTEINPSCDCPQVIYELESFADVEGPIVWDPVSGKIIYRPPNSDNRKRIIGPLMNSILSNALGQPKEKIPSLLEAGFKSMFEKHVLFYILDDSIQQKVDAFGIAGTISNPQGDYLSVFDANLGGRKSNLYVTQEVDQQINISKDGSVEKTVTITYKNPMKQDGWLNSVLPNWVRVYVPQGSQLVSADGLDDQAEPYDDLGKTVFAGYFELRPEGVSKVTLTYKLPFKVNKSYDLFIQKQPGKESPLYTIQLGKHSEEMYLVSDKQIKISI